MRNPNAIVLCVVNPFNPRRASLENGAVFGVFNEARLSAIQEMIDQMEDGEFWLDGLHSAFMGQAIRIIQESFDEFFISRSGIAIRPEISLPDWEGFKTNMVESVICHNMHIRLSGLLRTIFSEYLAHCYANGMGDIYFSDDLPKFGYIAHDHFLAVWEILRGLSEANEEEEN